MPAEDDVTYRVSLDTSQLESQLNDIRAKMDNVLGAYSPQGNSFGAAPSPQVPQFSPVDTPQPTSTLGILSNGWDRVSAPFHNLGGPSVVQEGLSPFATPSITGPGFRGISGPQGFENIRANMENAGIFSRAGRALGIGWDPTMPMSASDYQSMATGEFSPDAAAKMAAGAGSFGLGTAAGIAATAAGGPLAGIVADVLVSTLAEPVLKWAFTDPRQQEEYQRGQYFSRESQVGRQIGLTKGQGRETARVITDFMASTERYVQDYTEEEMDNMLRSFDTSGGFKGVTSAQEYTDRVRNFLENHRNVMHALRMSSDEASAAMGELTNLGLTDGTNVLGVSSQIRALSVATGQTPQQVINTIQQGESMAQGTGYYMPAAGMQLAQITGNITGMEATGTISQETLRQGGGVQNVAASYLQNAMTFSQTGTGRMMIAATLMNGGDAAGLMNMGTGDIASLAGRAFSDGNTVENILTFNARAESMTAAIGPDMMNLLEAKPILEAVRSARGAPLSQAEVIGALRNQFGLGNATVMSDILFESPEESSARLQKLKRTELQSISNLEPTNLQQIWGNIEWGVATPAKAIGSTIAAIPASLWETVGGEKLVEGFNEWNSGVVSVSDKRRTSISSDYKVDENLLDSSTKQLLNKTDKNNINTVLIPQAYGPFYSLEDEIFTNKQVTESKTKTGITAQDLTTLKNNRDTLREELEWRIHGDPETIGQRFSMNESKELTDLIAKNAGNKEALHEDLLHFRAKMGQNINKSASVLLNQLDTGDFSLIKEGGLFDKYMGVQKRLNEVDDTPQQGYTPEQLKLYKASRSTFDALADQFKGEESWKKTIRGYTESTEGKKAAAKEEGYNSLGDKNLNQSIYTLVEKIDRLIQTMSGSKYGTRLYSQ